MLSGSRASHVLDLHSAKQMADALPHGGIGTCTVLTKADRDKKANMDMGIKA